MNAGPSCSKPDIAGSTFGAGDLKTVMQHVAAARAVVRTIELAVKAQLDGSMTYENNGPERWQPAIDLAAAKLDLVREVLGDKLDSPPVNWWTPLCVLAAMGAALWHGNTRIQSEQLDGDDLDTMARVAIELFDSLMLELAGKEASHV